MARIVRVLLDTGSHRTFVARKVVQQAGIAPMRVKRLGIKTFGATEVDWKDREVVRFNLVALTGEERVNVEAFVVDEISEV